MRLEYLYLCGCLGLLPNCLTLLIFLLLRLNLQRLQVHLHLRLQGAGGIVTDKLGMSVVMLALIYFVKPTIANVQKGTHGFGVLPRLFHEIGLEILGQVR